MLTSKTSGLPSITTANDRFATIPKEAVPRSSFNRSCGYKTTFNAGELIPFYWDEVLPGDTHNVKATTLARLSTPFVPIMDNIWAETFFFFVPNRLLWTNWEKFNGQQTNPGDSTTFTVPIVSTPAPGWTTGSLADYFGIKPGITGSTVPWGVAAFYMRAYNLIWNEWFRDENLQNSITVNTDNGPDGPTDYVLRSRGRRHDYFTSCLPWPQKGTALRVPIDSVVTNNVSPTFTGGGYTNRNPYALADGDMVLSGAAAAAGTLAFGNQSGLAAIGGTINELRQAEQLQVLLERDARGGTRYTEVIRQHFGVISDDARLQRPEYLGGGKQNMNITPIPQTSVSAATPQGNLAATGTFGGSHGGFTKSFTEHGVIIGLIAVTADQTYQDGLDRAYSRQTRYDYFWPALQNLGEQAVLQKEIQMTDTAARENVFGYQERYGEYKHKTSQVTGLMRSSASGSLDIWHLAMDYSAGVALNSNFIADVPPIDRVVAVPTEPQIILDAYFNVTSARPMQTYSIPGGRL